MRGIVYCKLQLWHIQCNDTRWCISGTCKTQQPTYDHTTQCALLYIANRSYDTYNATILGDVAAKLAKRNNLRTTAFFERGGKDRRSRSTSRSRSSMILIKDRHGRRICPIFDPDNRSEDRSSRRRSRSRYPTLLDRPLPNRLLFCGKQATFFRWNNSSQSRLGPQLCYFFPFKLALIPDQKGHRYE